MSASNEWCEWHLTSMGWVKGSWKGDFNAKTVIRPKDTLMTCRYTERIASGYSKMERRLVVIWKTKNHIVITAERLRFGPCPEHI
jgi:hypothetical protein